MKSISCILFLFISVLASFSQDRVVEYYDNGKIKFEGYVKQKEIFCLVCDKDSIMPPPPPPLLNENVHNMNVLDSTYIAYFENGQIKEAGTLRDCDYQNGEVKHFSILCCDSIVSVNNFLFGKKHGKWKTFCESGKMQSVENFICGTLDGLSRYYNEAGQIKEKKYYTQARLKYSHEFDTDGAIIQMCTWSYETTDDGEQNETKKYVLFYPGGELKSERTIYDDKYSEFTNYRSNGYIEEKGTRYKNGGGNGTLYDENGENAGNYIIEVPIPIKKIKKIKQ